VLGRKRAVEVLRRVGSIEAVDEDADTGARSAATALQRESSPSVRDDLDARHPLEDVGRPENAALRDVVSGEKPAHSRFLPFAEAELREARADPFLLDDHRAQLGHPFAEPEADLRTPA
jgi:hypothetical protein